MKNKKPKKKLGTGLSQLLVKDDELASVIKKPGRPVKKVKPGELKQDIKKLLIQTNKVVAPMTLPIHDHFRNLGTSEGNRCMIVIVRNDILFR